MTPEEKKKIANRLTSEKYELKFNGRPISESALSSENISNAAGQATRSLFSNSAQLQQKRKTGEYPSAAEMKARSRPASANDGGFSGDNAAGWVGQGARQVAEPAAQLLKTGAKFTAGTAADAVNLIPRAAMRVSDNIYRGFTGQPANTEPFVMDPATQSLFSDNKQSPGRNLAGQALAADPGEMAREKQRGQQTNNTIPTSDVLMNDSRKQANPILGLPRPAPIIGDPERSIKNSQEWLRANKPGYAPGTAKNSAAELAQPATTEQTLLAENPSRMEVMNGNVSTTYGGPGGGVKTYVPFPTAPQPTTRTGNWESPEAQRAASEAYAQEVSAYRALNGQIPLDQAQAANANASAESESGMLGIRQKLGQASLGAADQEQEQAAMLFNAQKLLADGNSTPEQIEGANRVNDIFGKTAEMKVGRYKDKPVYDLDGNQIGTRTYDTATGRPADTGEKPLSKGAAAALEEVRKGSATKEHFIEMFPDFAYIFGQ